ncbi:MAG TPA: nucleotide disphospho-sugar-binding domain-containing protein [Chloroflexota bacterium]|jgi:MGT family glycosyltransferase|nr:nucleotide disphospho-sugar-binding domain-containing protein [Chloroflexota bacterium]
MSRFLIATLPVPGHVAPMAAIARALAQRGDEVVWYGSRFFASRIEATGARFVPISSTLDYGDSEYDRHFPERARLTGLDQVKFDFMHLFADAAPGYIKDLESILDGFPADALLGDPAVVATRIVGERRGLPWATLNISVLGLPSRDVAPFGLALPPDASTLGRLRNRALYWLARNVVFRDVNQHFAALGRQHGWKSFPFEPTVSRYLYLQPTIQSFEYPRSDLPPSVHFIGPILPDPLQSFTLPDWWADVVAAQRPIVLVTQGTIATNPEELLLPTLRALADEDVLVVGTTAGTSPDALGKLPGNARVAPFVPFAEIMPKVAAMVTNGGYGGVTIAMAHGVPVVTAGTSEDKPEVGNRVAAAGMGIRLKTAAPSGGEIRQCVRQVLYDLRYRERARALQAECATHDAAAEGADLLETLARTQQPVLRQSGARVAPAESVRAER